MAFHREQSIIERVACGLQVMAMVAVVTLAERLLDVVDDTSEAWDSVKQRGLSVRLYWDSC